MMTSRQPQDVPEPDADGGTTLPAAGLRPGRRLITVMLLAAAALDLARCGIVLATARHAGPATGLVAAGLAAAALSVRTARGCQSGRRWSAWAAVLIGAASAPQAAASGFHSPYTIPDIATAALGVLLAVAVLATAGQTRQPDQLTENPCLRRSARACRRCNKSAACTSWRLLLPDRTAYPSRDLPGGWRWRRLRGAHPAT